MTNNHGPSTESCGIPDVTLCHADLSPFTHTTTLQLLEVLDKWTEALDLGYSIDCIYMDYQKAFDTEPHKRLHNKLTSYGKSTYQVPLKAEGL
jgi:hypothetical protein